MAVSPEAPHATTLFSRGGGYRPIPRRSFESLQRAIAIPPSTSWEAEVRVSRLCSCWPSPGGAQPSWHARLVQEAVRV